MSCWQQRRKVFRWQIVKNNDQRPVPLVVRDRMDNDDGYWCLAYLCRCRIRADHMLVVDVDVIRAGADGQRFFLHVFAMLVAQLIVQLHVLWRVVHTRIEEET